MLFRNIELITKLFFLIMLTCLCFLSLETRVSAKPFKIIQKDSFVGFDINQFGIGWLQGNFEDYDINCELEDNAITSLNAFISIESINTGNKTRDRHLQTKQFFNSKKYPNITFKLIKPLKVNDQIMYGKLQIRGVEMEVSIPVSLNYMTDNNSEILKAKILNFEFNRDEYGLITYKKLISNLVQANIHVTFSSDEI
tara:strand:- start:1431 stop:2021 length:591 start_codon:yes stop_codon:yes gene_type:complete